MYLVGFRDASAAQRFQWPAPPKHANRCVQAGLEENARGTRANHGASPELAPLFAFLRFFWVPLFSTSQANKITCCWGPDSSLGWGGPLILRHIGGEVRSQTGYKQINQGPDTRCIMRPKSGLRPLVLLARESVACEQGPRNGASC